MLQVFSAGDDRLFMSRHSLDIELLLVLALYSRVAEGINIVQHEYEESKCQPNNPDATTESKAENYATGPHPCTLARGLCPMSLAYSPIRTLYLKSCV